MSNIALWLSIVWKWQRLKSLINTNKQAIWTYHKITHNLNMTKTLRYYIPLDAFPFLFLCNYKARSIKQYGNSKFVVMYARMWATDILHIWKIGDLNTENYRRKYRSLHHHMLVGRQGWPFLLQPERNVKYICGRERA